jgi:hypothetical protein
LADLPTEVLRDGAPTLLLQAAEAAVAALLCGHADRLDDNGRSGRRPAKKYEESPSLKSDAEAAGPDL